ncbi:hypothetical protein NFI96_004891 [Prochilodus magdalenae]|nr:hypothetical protein NFI96_004891 [Prochilodus magdalenae]
MAKGGKEAKNKHARTQNSPDYRHRWHWNNCFSEELILDWAEGKASQEVDFRFVLPFRELNLIKYDQYSLHDLLCDLHPDLNDLDVKIYDECKAVFIFDGLDESQITLDFLQSEKVSDITMTSSVGVLITHLIKRDLLPSALIWITSRPGAANQITPQYINRVTEIQGFSDPQKEEYFRKRMSDEDQARRIISHIKTTHMKNEKYEEKDERDPKNLLESNRTILLKLAELAFKQLMGAV